MRLETSQGKGIDNFREPEVTDYERKWDLHLGSLFPHAIRRTEASGAYNCHGLVFACRRTNVDSPASVGTILNHDNYQEVDLKDVKPGDVVVYYSDKTGDANHSGTVVDVKPIEGLAMVVSKWGRYAEYIHEARHCPSIYGPIIKYFRCRL